MKKTVLLLGLISLFACDKPKSEVDSTAKQTVETTNVPQHITYHSNGMVNTIADIENGMLNGIRIEIDTRGNVKRQNMYLNDKLDGLQLKYGNSGRIELKANYKNGVLDGEFIKYNNNGKMQESCVYVNGKKHGEAAWYYSSGKISMSYPYVNGEINGTAKKYYDISGEIKSQVNFENSKMIGQWSPEKTAN